MEPLTAAWGALPQAAALIDELAARHALSRSAKPLSNRPGALAAIAAVEAG